MLHDEMIKRMEETGVAPLGDNQLARLQVVGAIGGPATENLLEHAGKLPISQFNAAAAPPADPAPLPGFNFSLKGPS